MGRDISETDQIEVDASVDDVWDAIATGPGIDSWFMGRNSISGGVVHTGFGDCEIVTEEPGKRFGYATQPGPDGRFIGYDFLVEGRDGASTSIRIIASGFLPGDDWHDEFVAMGMGHALFFRTLAEYLTFFPGRTATPLTAVGPAISDWSSAFATLTREFGRSAPASQGANGIAYFANDHCLAVRTPDALYRLVRGLDGRMVAMHHIFGPPEEPAEWSAWLTRVLP